MTETMEMAVFQIDKSNTSSNCLMSVHDPCEIKSTVNFTYMDQSRIDIDV